VIIGVGGLIQGGEYVIYSLREEGGRIVVTEEGICTGVIQILTYQTKLWAWKAGFGMWTTFGFSLADFTMSNRSSKKSVDHILAAYIVFLRS